MFLRIKTAALVLLCWLVLSANSCVDTIITFRIDHAQKISTTSGNLNAVLEDGDAFGSAIAPAGDLDDDDETDLAVGAPGDDDGGDDRGAVWIVYGNADGSAKSRVKISDTEGNFAGVLNDTDRFGSSITSLGDLDGDGIGDIAAGAPNDDDGGIDRGAVWVLFLNDDGSVRAHEKISSTSGGFTGVLDDADHFGTALAAIGDLDGDGITDLAVSATGDDDGGTDHGAVWILFMDANGTVKASSKISAFFGGFGGAIVRDTSFGDAITGLGDFNSDGFPDIAVGAPLDDTGGEDRGAVWMIYLNPDGTTRSYAKIAHGISGVENGIADGDHFGSSIAAIGDLDRNGTPDLAVGADHSSGGGAVWVLFMQDASNVSSQYKLSAVSTPVLAGLTDGDRFGSALTNIGDRDDNGSNDLVVGADGTGDGGVERGAVWTLFLMQPEIETKRKYFRFGD